MDHIVYRHGPGSTQANAGRFAPGTTVDEIVGMIDETLAQGRLRADPLGRSATIYEHDFDHLIGIDWDGLATRTLWVVVRDGTIVSAYPYGRR
jgi:hypothetical protein